MITRSKDGTCRPRVFYSSQYSVMGLFDAHTPLEPSCFTQADKDPRWWLAMADEYNVLISNGTWVLVPSEPHQNVVGCKWAFRIKRKADGSIDCYKARLVTKGYNQQEGLDYDATFSPAVKPITVRMVLSLAVSFNWPIKQLDVRNAFLNGILQEDVVMQQPIGFVDPALPHHV